jgi:hypothetical protein
MPIVKALAVLVVIVVIAKSKPARSCLFHFGVQSQSIPCLRAESAGPVTRPQGVSLIGVAWGRLAGL